MPDKIPRWWHISSMKLVAFLAATFLQEAGLILASVVMGGSTEFHHCQCNLPYMFLRSGWSNCTAAADALISCVFSLNSTFVKEVLNLGMSKLKMSLYKYSSNCCCDVLQSSIAPGYSESSLWTGLTNHLTALLCFIKEAVHRVE